MTNTTKLLRVAVPGLLAVGVVAAVVFGRARGKRETILPAGTRIVAVLQQEVSTAESHAGDEVQLRTVGPLRLRDGAQIPPGVEIRGTVTDAKGGGRIAGTPELGLRFTELTVDGETHAIAADPFRVRGNSDARQSAMQIGGGAVAGGILGRVFGGKGGTLKGAASGAAVGTGVAVATKGDQVVLRAGQQVTVRLTRPVTVAYRPQSEGD